MNPIYQTALLAFPSQGQKLLPMRLDFTAVASLDRDLTEEIQSNHFSFVQSIYVDNSLNTGPITFSFNNPITGGYRLTVAAYRQGWYPVAVPKGECRFIAQTAQGIVVPIILANVAMPYFEYGPADGSAAVPVLTNDALAGALVNGDNIIVPGVLAQTIRLYRGIFSVDAPAVLKFTDGPGGTLLFAAQLTAGGSLTFQASGVPWFATTPGNDLILNSDAVINLYGGFGYVQG